MDEQEKVVLAKWEELKVVFGGLEVDVAKSARGVSAASVRARKGLRELKAVASALVKLTIESDKTRKASKPPRVKKPKAEKTA
jgi:hypothetical protein